jgi:hypothetical protein
MLSCFTGFWLASLSRFVFSAFELRQVRSQIPRFFGADVVGPFQHSAYQCNTHAPPLEGLQRDVFFVAFVVHKVISSKSAKVAPYAFPDSVELNLERASASVL